MLLLGFLLKYGLLGIPHLVILIFRVHPVEIFRIVAATLILEKVLLSSLLLVLTSNHWRVERLTCAHLIKDEVILIEFWKIPIDHLIVIMSSKLVKVGIRILIYWLVVIRGSTIF